MTDMDNTTGNNSNIIPMNKHGLHKAIQATKTYITAMQNAGIDVCGLPDANKIHLYDVRMHVDMEALTKADFHSNQDDAYTTQLSFVFEGVTFYSIYTDAALFRTRKGWRNE